MKLFAGKEIKHHNEEGFTLIELIVTILVIGILVAIAIPIFANQQKASIVSSVQKDVKSTATELATVLVKRPKGVIFGVINDTTKSTTISTSAADSKVLQLNLVRSRPSTVIQVLGTWDRYYVVGVDTSVGAWSTFTMNKDYVKPSLTMTTAAGQFGVLFDSTTGKLRTEVK